MVSAARAHPRVRLWFACLWIAAVVANVGLASSGGVNPARVLRVASWTTLAAATLLLGYALFFWVQRYSVRRRAFSLATRLDELVPFVPAFIWVYSGLYYIGLVAPIAYASTDSAIGRYLAGGLALLIFHCAVFAFAPCVVPSGWRELPAPASSAWLFRFVRTIDNGRSCFPSLHVALATYAVSGGIPDFPAVRGVYLGLVLASCLFVKQHQLLDLPLAVGLGWLARHLVAL